MVRYFTPNSTEAVITRRRFSVPALCPASRGKPRESAQRPLPSMIMATWRGILSRGTLIGVSVITIIRHCEWGLGATWQSLIKLEIATSGWVSIGTRKSLALLAPTSPPRVDTLDFHDLCFF